MACGTDEVNPDPGRIASYRDPQLQVLFAVTLMTVLGVASIGPALPLLRRELAVPVESVGLVITMFTLPGVVLTPVMGVLADRIGRKRVLVPSLMLFALAGVGCALAHAFESLLVLRFLQGVGAATLGALNVTLIGDLFRGRQRTAAMGYNASVLSIGTATYPLVGGGLAMLAWNLPFVLPIFALPVAAMVALRMEEPAVDRAPSLGIYLGGVWREARRPQALALFAASCGVFVLLYGAYVTFLPLYMADRFGSTPLAIGSVMTSASVMTALTSSQLGRLSRHLREADLLRLGFVACAFALVLIPFMPVMFALLIPAGLLGFSFALTIPVVMTLLAGIAPDDRRAAFMSLNGTVLRIGQTIGPLVMTAVFATAGFTAVYVAAAIVALSMAGLMAVCLAK